MKRVRSEEFAACVADGQEDIRICRLAPSDGVFQADAGLVTVEASNESVGRDLHIIYTAGWVLGPFQENPVIEFGHDATSPAVGRAVGVYKTPDRRLMLTVEWAPTPIGQTLSELYAKRFMRAWSTGWMPGEYRFSQDKARQGGIDFIKGHELLEVSAVVVGSLRSALSRTMADARSAGIDTRPLCEFAEQKLDQWPEGKAAVGIMRRSEVEDLWTVTKELPNVRRLPDLTRAGKVLSAENHRILRQAHRQMLDAADMVDGVCQAAGHSAPDGDEAGADAAQRARRARALKMRFDHERLQ